MSMNINANNIQIGQLQGKGGQEGVGPKHPFANMRAGQSVNVEVVQAGAGKMTLVKTSDGQTVQADFPGAPVLMAGDKLELTMMDRGGGRMQMQLTAVNGQAVHVGAGELEVRLMDMGVQPSEFNSKAAQFLMDRNVQPTAERINNMVNIATRFPEIPAAAALFMVANNITVNKNNVNTLMEWLQGGDLLGDKADQLSEAVQQMINGQQEEGQAQQAGKAGQAQGMQAEQPAPMAGKAAMAAQQEMISSVLRDPTVKSDIFPLRALSEFAATVTNMSEGEARAAITEFLNQFTMSPQQKAAFGELLLTAYQNGQQAGRAVQQAEGQQPVQPQMQMPTMPEQAQSQGAPQGGQAIQTQPQTQGQATQQAVAENQNQQAANQPTQPQSAVGEQPQTANVQQGQPVQNAQAQQPTVTQQVPPQATAEGAQPPQGTQTTSPQGAEVSQQQGTAPPQTEGTQAQNTQQQQNIQQPQSQNTAPEQQVTQELKQVIQQLEKLVVSMKQNPATDAENLQEAVKNQRDVADGIKTSLSRIAGEQNPVTQKAADISSRIQMGNNLDNFYYCQIPFEINQRQSTAELYVFERKNKNGQEDRTNTTILIALETQNLGRVETVMRAQQENMTIEFRVQSDHVQTYLEKSADELIDIMRKNDFKVAEVKVLRTDVQTTPLNVDQVLGEKIDFKMQAIDINV